MSTASSGTIICLVRHGEVHNPRRVLYGRLPRFGLSKLGREQAARAARFLASAPLAAIYASPRLRARQTAHLIATHHPAAPLCISSLIDEVRTSWQGVPEDSLGRNFNFYEPLRDPDDETIAAISRRVCRLVERLRRRHPCQHVVCVSHGDPIVIARTVYAGLPLEFASLRRDYPRQASLTSLHFDGNGVLPRIEYLSP